MPRVRAQVPTTTVTNPAQARCGDSVFESGGGDVRTTPFFDHQADISCPNLHFDLITNFVELGDDRVYTCVTF